MPYLVRERLFIGNIGDAFEVLQGSSGSQITHILSVLSSASISFFGEWRRGVEIPTKEIKKVYVGEDCSKDGGPKSALAPNNLLYALEYAGKDLRFVRMAVPLRDMERENLLDYLDVCLDFIAESRKIGSVLVHCFAGVSRSAAIITAYLMKMESLSLEGLTTFLIPLHLSLFRVCLVWGNFGGKKNLGESGFPNGIHLIFLCLVRG
uniref:protein-tyrosine-phosphatase n=1 Tax=Kalanchoe fedtschenkoi TaxID=63787 RepID=A0A7N0T7Z4_KALFE